MEQCSECPMPVCKPYHKVCSKACARKRKNRLNSIWYAQWHPRWYADNRVRLAKQRKEKRAANPEIAEKERSQRRDRYRRNHERILAAQKVYQARNKAKVKQWARKTYLKRQIAKQAKKPVKICSECDRQTCFPYKLVCSEACGITRRKRYSAAAGIRRRRENPEQLKIWNKNWLARNPNYHRDWKRKNASKSCAASKKYRAAWTVKKRKEVAVKKRQWRLENREKVLAQKLRYRLKNPEKARESVVNSIGKRRLNELWMELMT